MKRRAVFILGAMWNALVRGWRRDCVVGGMETRFQWRKAHSRTAKCEAFHIAPRLFFMFLFLIPFTIRQHCIIYPQEFSTEPKKFNKIIRANLWFRQMNTNYTMFFVESVESVWAFRGFFGGIWGCGWRMWERILTIWELLFTVWGWCGLLFGYFCNVKEKHKQVTNEQLFSSFRFYKFILLAF